MAYFSDKFFRVDRIQKVDPILMQHRKYYNLKAGMLESIQSHHFAMDQKLNN